MTSTVKVKVPDSLGIPLNAPVLASSANPWGSGVVGSAANE